jgi:hypothetical protein
MISTAVLSSSHLSSNRVWGQLGATTPTEILEGCRSRRVTGEIRFHSAGKAGKVELRAGFVERVDLDGATGDDALASITRLDEGTFEVVQRLPDLAGALGSAAEFQGELGEISLIQLMRHAESHALTVTITVLHGWDRAAISYRDGELLSAEVNGDADPDRLAEALAWPTGAFRVLASALELPVPARRAPRRAPTEPFQVGHVAALRRAERERAAPVAAAPVAVAPVAAAPTAVAAPTGPVTAAPTATAAPTSAVATARWFARIAGARTRNLLRQARRAVDWLDARVAR